MLAARCYYYPESAADYRLEAVRRSLEVGYQAADFHLVLAEPMGLAARFRYEPAADYLFAAVRLELAGYYFAAFCCCF